MISSFIALNIIFDVGGMVISGFVLGLLINWLLKKKGYEIKKHESSKHLENKFIGVIFFLLIVMIALPANKISIYIGEWITYVFLVIFFFWPEFANWKSGEKLWD